MNRTRILAYALGWAPAVDKPFIKLRLENGPDTSVPVNSAAEFAALAALLTHNPVFFRDDGLIETDMIKY